MKPWFNPDQSLCVLLLTKYICKVHLDYSCFPLLMSFLQCSILIFIYMLLIPEGEKYEPGKLQNQTTYFRRSNALHRKVGSFASFADDLGRKPKYLLQN